MARRRTLLDDDPVTRTLRHLEASVTKVDQRIEVSYGAGGASYGDFAAHVADHLRYDPHIRPADFPTEPDKSGGFDVGAAIKWARHRSIEELVELHERAHHDVCAGCTAPVLAVHSASTIYPVWFHADRYGVSCADDAQSKARPARFSVAYATVMLSMRLRLPSALGPNPDPGDVEAFFDEHFVSYFTDEMEEPFMGDPVEIVDQVTMASDVSGTPRIA